MNHIYALKKTQGILLFLFALLNPLCAILGCFQFGLFPYYLRPFIVSFPDDHLRVLLALKKDMDGEYHAHLRMVTRVVIISALFADAAIAFILTQDQLIL